MQVQTSELLECFNRAHESIKFTIEIEERNALNFLDVRLERRIDGSIRRSVYRKSTWNGQYVHFESFVPLKQKRNLVRCLTKRAERICTEDTLKDELEFIRNIFIQNGYPMRFVEKHMCLKQRSNITTVGKKPVYVSLPFKGDVHAERLTRRLTKAVQTTYFAANLVLSFHSVPIVKLRLKDRLPNCDASFCIYSFECSCRASYIGRTTRRLSERISEHHPAWLRHGEMKTITSAIVGHLADTGHRIEQTNAFQVVYRVPKQNSSGLRRRLLSIAEAVCIRIRNPDLCAQKRFVRTLSLPWSEVKQTCSKQTENDGII